MSVNDFSEASGSLLRASASMGTPLSQEAANQLGQYLVLLSKWNKVYNLTAVRDPEQMRVQHINDSLAVLGPLRKMLPHDAARILDVGSGAGLPGVVLSVADPSLQVTCVDTVGKKISFIQQVAAELHLPNLIAKQARIESFQDAPYDVITSRAFSSLSDFVALTRHLLPEGGVWMALKGKVPSEEITDLPQDIEVFHVEQIKVPDLDAQRCIVWMRRK